MTYLDSCQLQHVHVGYGELGRHGRLGYEGKTVTVQGRPYPHALSTHPPAHLRFRLDGRFTHFHCHVALNDDVPAGRSHADFTLLVDGRRVATAPYVVAGAAPRPLDASLAGARTLELIVRTSRWEHCHAVWLDPRLATTAVSAAHTPLIDCLGRTEISRPAAPLRARRCIASVVSPGFEGLLDDMLGSLAANGGCQDALLVVFVVGDGAAARAVLQKYGAVAIPCRPHARVNPTVKAALYSIAHVVDAEQFVCLDADMLVLDDLNPLFAAIDALPEGRILACREGNGRGWHTFQNLQHALCSVYGGHERDLRRLVGNPNGEGAYPLVVNDGLFAGGRAALLALDGTIRAMTQAPAWTDERRDIWWRNQFVFNLALARLHCGVELDETYNVQLNSHEVEWGEENGRLHATWHERPARVLHFNGLGRQKYPAWRNRFAAVPDPLIGGGGGDGYAAFVAALRAWVGRHGLRALAWSFYGRADAQHAAVADPATFPLLALLHYLVRANGCVRVLETGTARGVSAACLASAVAHRRGGRVVTFDPAVFPERETLWAALPAVQRHCIEPRAVDSLAGMAAALAAGEQYEAALLDSLHTADHVWAEFELAARLVCPGGLILIHDACLPGGSVAAALARITAAGYAVTRLWTAAAGAAEDDGLGLALIENRKSTEPPDMNKTE